MERRLGRGLGSLLPASKGPESPNEIQVEEIRPNPHQPRRTFDEDGLHELCSSIKNHGVLQPIVVRPAEGGGYELISGERRLRASKAAGRETIPAVVRHEVSEGDMLELALVENVQRRDLDPMERARGFSDMMKRLGLNQSEVADRVGLKRSSVSNHVRLLELPPEIQTALSERKLSMGHAKAVLSLGEREEQVALAREIVRKGLSVRDAEEASRASTKASQPAATESPSKEASVAASGTLEPWARDLQTRIQDHLGTKVVVAPGTDGAGSIQIHYFNRDDLDRVCTVLAPRKSL